MSYLFITKFPKRILICLFKYMYQYACLRLQRLKGERLWLHGGPKLVLSALSRNYNLICGTRIIKSVLHRCPQYYRYSGRRLHQQMASLPIERLDLVYPFAVTGLDFAGPIKETPSKGRGITSTKGYICIFICFVTKFSEADIER